MTSPKMNGTRHPHDISASGDILRVMIDPTTAPSSSEAAWLAIWKLP